MNPLKILTTPEYLFRPSQVLVRIRRGSTSNVPEQGEVRLPWGDLIDVRPRETIGSELWFYGIFDLAVAEALSRLADAGETALDIGANIGQMTSLLSARVGPQGRVIAFEPHPELFSEVERLVRRNSRGGKTNVDLRQLALSHAAGEGRLEMPPAWATNRGLGKLAESGQPSSGRILSVKLATLDELLGPEASIGLCKIDVEGHELSVFQGARRLLREKRIRDIVFEDFQTYPSQLHTLFCDHGYQLFSLHAGWLKPRLERTSTSTPKFEVREGANYLATLEPERAEGRFSSLGWKALSRQR